MPSGLRTPNVQRLFAVALFGPILHLTLDFLNSYGLHPFWPINSNWFYGDTLFIVEPWLLLIFSTGLIWSTHSRAAKIVLGFIVALLIVLCWSVGVLSIITTMGLSAGAAAMLLTMRRIKPWSRIALTAGLATAVLITFRIASGVATSRIESRLASAFPELQTLEVAALPSPGNPMCWTLLAVQRSDTQYMVHVVRTALLPAVMPSSACPIWIPGGTAPRASTPGAPPNDALINWDGSVSASLGELNRLVKQHCWVRPFLRFARVPFWVVGDSEIVLGDVRFDRNERLDFSELRLARSPGTCPENVPP